MAGARFDRQIAFFGAQGQDRLRAASVAVVGVGGLGSIVAQNLALLGVGKIALIEPEEADETNRNRHVCLWHGDPVPGTLKVDIAERMIRLYNPTVEVIRIGEVLQSQAAFRTLHDADFVFGCVDSEGARLVLTEFCAAFKKPYIDAATDIPAEAPGAFGGRVCCSMDGDGCLVCLGLLDSKEAAEDLESPEQRRDRTAIYGVLPEHLGRSGPSVVTINTVVAGLVTTEFMKACTGLAQPSRVINYYGHLSRMTVRKDPPSPDCYFCKSVWGTGDESGVNRFANQKDRSSIAC